MSIKSIISEAFASHLSSARSSDIDTLLRHHSNQARMHREQSHIAGNAGDYEAEAKHDRAADAHELARDQLYYPDDKAGYDTLASAADRASARCK